MKVGTRDSKLAMKQTEIFVERMNKAGMTENFEVTGIKAMGDLDLKSSLDKMEGVGAFVRELDAAIIAGSIDVSVNSLKDIPVDMDEKLTIGAVLSRDAVEDVILPCPLDEVPEGATVGTASVRRMSLLKELRPDLNIVPLRGNIHTRMEKLDAGECYATILAKAGFERMGINRPHYAMDPDFFVPAAAQGAIAVECRSDDTETLAKLALIDDRVTRQCVMLERRIMSEMGAGCSSPVGINVKKLVKGFRVRAVSYAFTEKPVRLDTVISHDYDDTDVSSLAKTLRGEISK
jgi:hydroxymethylbilane synthase